jgi:hypothetical protein
MDSEPKEDRMYLALQNDAIDGNDINAVSTVHGPFKSIREEESFIRQDALDTATDCEDLEMLKAGENPDWGSAFTIVEVVKTVRPVPIATVTVKLRRVKPEGVAQ